MPARALVEDCAEDCGSAARHPWEIARAAFFVRLFCKQLVSGSSASPPVHVLDVGAGDGFFARQLIAALPAGSSVRCLDSGYSDELLVQLQARAPAGLSFSRARWEQRFDAVIMLDVLEHVIDDHGFLRAIVSQSLRPGGSAILSMPAHPLLYSQHDLDLGHHRRYTQRALRELVANAGLSIEQQGGLFTSLLLARSVQKGLELARGVRSMPAPAGLAAQIATGVGDWQGGPMLSAVLCTGLSVDAAACALAARLRIPLPGLSLWAIARMP